MDGERIYYKKLKDFGATQDYELRFIQRIQKHKTTAFFHNGKLYIPSRQGRSVPLAIGLQWEAWQEQQAKVEELQTLYTQQGINMLKMQKRVDEAIRLLVEAELYQSEPNIDLAVKALKGE